jgi:hypothetical protein
MSRRICLTDRPPSAPDPDREIPYLICKECGTPCYVFEIDMGQIREALCVACGNESVTDFLFGDWEDES